MNISISTDDLKKYLGNQLNNFFPDNYSFKGSDIDSAFSLALDRTENCFKHIILRGYRDELGNAFFSHLHSDQYAQFLYFFSNSLWKISENKVICDKVLLLNKLLNAFFISYKGNLPDIFLLGHPVGSIIGNAHYSNFLVIYQNVTINTSVDEKGNEAPILGQGLALMAGAKIIGNKTIGDRVTIGVDAVVNSQDIKDDMVVLKDKVSGKQIIRRRRNKDCFAQSYFDIVF